MDAAARGDARAALEHHLSGLTVEGSLHPHRLREIVDLTDDAPGWVYSRWCVDQAFQWMLMNRDPRTDDAVRTVLTLAHLDHVEPLLDRPTELQEYGTIVAACDWLVQQLCVYEHGGLQDFLDVRAEPELVERADLIGEWADAPWGVYRLVELRGSVLVVRDLAHEVDLELLNIGAFVDQADVVLGRVVPVSVPPFRMFESRPVPLDELTAEQAAMTLREGDAESVLQAIWWGRHQGRLERGFSCHEITMYANDIVPESAPAAQDRGEVPGRLRQLRGAGLDDFVANGVMVAEVAVIAATIGGESPVTIGPHLTAVLTDSRVFSAALVHCVVHENGPAWRRLADATASPVSERCAHIADLCEQLAA